MSRPSEAGLYGTSISCGVRELRGVSWTQPRDLIQRFDFTECAHVVFSDNLHEKSPSGEGFAQYLKKNKLGMVVQSVTRVNPNSRNRIAVWVWTPNKAAVRRLLHPRKANAKA